MSYGGRWKEVHFTGLRVITHFRREVHEKYALPGYFAASNCNLLQTFRENLSVPSSRVMKMGPTVLHETSVRN